MILKRIFEDQEYGFYIDIGAHHPKRFSNTYFFYKRGWNGINIDALPNSMILFNKFRSRDINIEQPISNIRESIIYYHFNEPALNGFSKDLSDERTKDTNYFIKNKEILNTERLDTILDKYLPNEQKIDFLSIDVEGYDFNVLRSNSFEKYEPKVILIEILEDNLKDIHNNEIYLFLNDKNYMIYAKCVNTVIFMTEKFYNESHKKNKL